MRKYVTKSLVATKSKRESKNSLKKLLEEGEDSNSLQSDYKLTAKGLHHPRVGVQTQDTIGG